MRFTIRRRSTAVASALCLVAASAVMITGFQSNAQAFSGTQAVACHLYFGGGNPGTPAGNDSLLSSNSVFEVNALTASPATPSVGQTVTVTLASTNGFFNGPVAISPGAINLSATIDISGAQTGSVTVTAPEVAGAVQPTGNYPAVATPPTNASGANSLGGFALSGTFTASTSGSTTLAFKRLFSSDLSGSGANNYCDGKAAGTTGLPPGTTANFPTNGTTYATTNYSNDPDANDFVTTGFQIRRIAAGPTTTWRVPLTWDPKNAAAISSSIKQDITVTGPQPELTLTKTAVQDNFIAAGDVIDYEYKIKNTGAAVADGPFTITDDKIASVTCPSDATLAINATITCTGSYTAVAGDVTAGQVVNKATANGAAPLKSAEVTVTVGISTAGITLAKSATTSSFEKVGDAIGYSYVVTNSGNIPLTAVGVSDDKVATVTCPATTLAPAATTTCTGSYSVVEGDLTAGTVTNIATATGTPGAAAPVTSASSTVTVNIGTPSIAMVKSSTTEKYTKVGDVINYNFVVLNDGQATLTGVVITDPKVANATCPNATLAPAASQTCTGTYTVVEADITAGTVVNTATASGTYRGTTVTSAPSTVTVAKGQAGGDIPSTVTETVTGINCYNPIGGVSKWTAAGAVVPGAPAGTDPKITVALTPQAPSPGGNVDVAVTFSQGIANGPTTLNGGVRPAATVQLTGGVTKRITVVGAPYVGPGPTDRLPGQTMTLKNAFKLPADSAIVKATVESIAFDSNVASKGGKFNWPAPQADLSTFTTVCNKSATPQTDSTIKAIGVTAAVPFTGTVTAAPTLDPGPTSVATDPAGNGSDLPQTGGNPLASLIVALILFQLGIILAVRSVRATPRSRGAHA